VRGFIGGNQAGYYAAAQKLASVVYLVAGVFGLVLFPRVSANKAVGDSSYKLLMWVVGAVGVICLLITLPLIAFPETFVRLVFGGKYVAGESLVPILAVAVLCFALVSIVSVYLLATDRFVFVYFLMSGILLEVIGIAALHDSIKTVAFVVLAVAVITLTLVYGYLAVLFIKDRRGKASERARLEAST
ncbi:MAG: lipopolysaccharide biosynthesis protein, partial [Candidatus Geothermincolia bacterium]